MGVTRFSGPVYGSKCNLLSFGPFAAAGGSTAAIYKCIVPAYETWYVTEFSAYQGQATSNSSTPVLILKAKGTSTSASYAGPGPDPNFPTGNAGTVATITGPTSTATWSALTIPTATAGEYEGYAIPANSSVRVVSSGTMGQISFRVDGFKRYLDSTRAV